MLLSLRTSILKYGVSNLSRWGAVSSRALTTNVAVVGSGPAGFYTTQSLLKNPDVKVDIYEKLPVPFGLVRYGVAPDHAEVKNVMKSFTSVANNNRVTFIGNVALGDIIQLEDLIDAYHAVVLCYGSAQDKMLDIEGERTTKNTISARDFVGWYNGVPENKNLEIDLNCDTACIIGQGNVALDCARILARPANLEKTDITSFAQKRLSESKIKRIYIIGRRGPIQVSFTIKELRELIKLDEVSARMEPSSLFQEYQVSSDSIRVLSRPRRRLTELLFDLSLKSTNGSPPSNKIELIFKFLSKPLEIVGHQESNNVEALRIEKSRYDDKASFLETTARPSHTGDIESVPCGLIIRSIGYKAVMVDKSLPYNQKLGSILNTDGRVNGHKSLYCSGWLATGATGVIAGTLNSAQITARSILDDIHHRAIQNLSRLKPGSAAIIGKINERGVQVVTFRDWTRIDELEKHLGEVAGKTREKFVDVEKMLEVAINNKKT